MLVRPATIEDMSQVYDLLNALRMESIWATIPVTPIQPYVNAHLLMILHDPEQRLVVADREGELVGICRGTISSHEYLPGLRYLAERDLYVLPRYRGFVVGKALWGDLLAWGKAQGAYGACYGKITRLTEKRCVEEVMWRVFDQEPIHA